MALVYIGIGSNIDKEHHVPAAIAELERLFGQLRVSPIFESVAVNCIGDNCTGENYYNLVVECETELTINGLMQLLKQLEIKQGRKPTDRRYEPRTLDLDLLLYDNIVQSAIPILPRPEILHNAFVLWPLAQLAPALIHPQQGVSMAALWQAFDKSKQQLALAPLQWPKIRVLV
jgi:2-amino-4-hydroxy-6-hydroxymethyldihydropteridine diphosphokinase